MITGFLLPALAGGMIGAGAFAVVRAMAAPHPRATRTGWGTRATQRTGNRPVVWVAGALVAGAGTGVVTGWPVTGVLAAAAVWWLPGVLGPDRMTVAEADRVEAVAAWTEQLRDMIAGASGLQHAITATAEIAPQPIRHEVSLLARQVRAGRPVSEAMGDFAQRVDNATADLVAVALSTAEGRHAADLGALLGRLAESSRDRATMLVRTSAARARVRSSVRIIVAVTALMLAGMVGFNREYLAPFDTITGQVVLALVGGIWAGGLWWLVRLAKPVPMARFLRPVGAVSA